MGTRSPNTTLLEAKYASASDLTPAPLSGSASQVSFAFKQILPPSELYVNVDDQLIVSAATSQTAEVVTVNVRLLLPTGRIEDMQFQIRPANTRTVLKQSFGLAEGYLLSMSATAAVAVSRGQTFVRVALQRSAGGAGQPAYCLMADYATTQSIPGYPNGRILSPTEGPGNLQTLHVGNPAAGADWTVSVPTNARWKVRSWSAVLTTSAAVANRNVIAIIQSTPGTIFAMCAALVAVASKTYIVSATPVTPYTPINTNYLSLPLPTDCILTGIAGILHAIAVTTLLLDVADQWSNINLLIEEWLDNV